jgi:hypothetical protein
MVGADDQVADAEHLLAAIIDRAAPPTPLSTGALLVNGHRQPRIGHEVAHELDSAERVDLL